MIDPYDPCPCGSGKKTKFCCSLLLKKMKSSTEELTQVPKRFPLHQCLIRSNWQEDGLAVILVTRQLPNLNFICGSYCVDTFCLGLKDTFLKFDIDSETLEQIKDHASCDWTTCDYETARGIILGGIDYAAKFGFFPNPDWKLSKHLIEPEGSFQLSSEFGKDGQPFYIQGPHDNSAKILAQLRQTTGDKFHYMLRVG